MVGLRRLLARAKRAVVFFLGAKKTWRWPDRVDVLIYDTAGRDLFADYLQNRRVGILHVRGEQLNMRALMGCLFRRGNRWTAYVDLLVEHYRPRLVLTFIDNAPSFWGLKQRHPDVTTMFVQNGIRSYYMDAFELLDSESGARPPYHVDYMMTFGSRIGEEYSKHIGGVVVPIGSLKNNIQAKRRSVIPGTIAFISQFRATDGLVLGSRSYSHNEFFGNVDKVVLQFVGNYVDRHGKQLFVIPCSNLKQEREYFECLLGPKCFFTNEAWNCSSYEALDTAEVVVTIESTLGYESLARGARTAFFSIRSEATGLHGMTYGWPDITREEGPFWCNSRNPEAFERVLNHLFSITDDEFRAELAAEKFSEIMEYDPGNTILSRCLTHALA